MSDVTSITRQLDDRFLEIHGRKESAFWKTRMGIDDQSDVITTAEMEMKDFLGDVETLSKLRALAERANGDAESDVLRGWILTFERNAIQTREGRDLYRACMEAERALNQARRDMKLGYVDPSTGTFTRASSVALSNGLSTGTREAFRRACWEGLLEIERFVLSHGFPEIVRLRNRFARAEGYADFYEYKVRTSEGFGKETVFELLGDLEARTREKARRELDGLAAREGASAIAPWNLAYHAGGSLASDREPYFRFDDALGRWVRSFAALGIRYAGATLTLDLIEREGKYENGFMHGPNPAFQRDGVWHPATINFTANAIPNRVGSGQRAAQTLFHEGGHAAHFANICQASPCYSHEFAPMSVAMAETQAMFLDSILGDAGWQTRYAKNAEDEPIPFEILEQSLRMSRPFHAHQVRAMMSIPYTERTVYELADEEVTADRLAEIARASEARLVQTPGGSPRPVFSIPHLLSWESSAYYHGYVLARMAVRQTREHFLDTYGVVVDNAKVGPDLARTYWAPGSSRSFLELVEALTGSPLSADALVDDATCSVEEALDRARRNISRLEGVPASEGPPDLDMQLRIVHGREVVVEEGTPIDEAVLRYAAWVREGWPRDAGD